MNTTTAKTIDAIAVLNIETLPSGVKVVIVPCYDYDALAALPQAIELEGARYGRTGWNSDQRIACFRSDATFAVAC